MAFWNDQQPHSSDMQFSMGQSGIETDEFSLKISEVQRTSGETIKIVQKIEQERELFNIKCDERRQFEGYVNYQQTQNPHQFQVALKNFTAQKQRQDMDLRRRLTHLSRKITDMEERLEKTINILCDLQTEFQTRISQWRLDQQLAVNEKSVSNGAVTLQLDKFQTVGQSLTQVIWESRQQLKRTEILKKYTQQYIRPSSQSVPPLPDKHFILRERVTQLLLNLLSSGFIVDLQPPQAIMTNSNFESRARLLVGQSLNIHMMPPQVQVTIISEDQARTLMNLGSSGQSGEILNNKTNIKFDPATQRLTAHFKNLKLKSVTRRERRCQRLVTEQKFYILFQSQFTIGEKKLDVNIWILSLPIIVIVSKSQERHAWATISWDNTFRVSRQNPFDVPETVPWSKFVQLLQAKSRGMTGRGLTQEHLQFLFEKIFDVSHPHLVNSDRMVTWTKFCKENLPEREFTFWQWFYTCLKLIAEHLRGPWNEGKIAGIVGKTEAERMIAGCPIGTFLLRFSDSELGGITIVWKKDYETVKSLAPFNSAQLTKRSLADCLIDIPFITHLYPDIPKAQAFEKYTGKATNGDSGYVGFTIVIKVDDGDATQSSRSNSSSESSPSSSPHFNNSHYLESPIRNEMEFPILLGTGRDGVSEDWMMDFDTLALEADDLDPNVVDDIIQSL